MKNYMVGIIAPAYADVFVSAETEEEAIEKVKALLEAGEEPEFDVDTGEPEDLDYEILPLEKGADEAAPNLRLFTVMMEATSSKCVPIRAVSEDAALELARKMYFNSDTLDFTNDDVVRVISRVAGFDDPEASGAELRAPII